jgi:hypothetical protein
LIFDYPESRTERIHGPDGYSSYERYRSWLRDEFTFRCAYCLKREAWGTVTGDFEVDHFQPQSLAPNLKLNYVNLVYACRRCNLIKLDQQVVDDPLTTLWSDSTIVWADGSITSNRTETKRLIRQLDLNSGTMREFRRLYMRVVDLARERDPSLYRQLTGFPSDLPDLRRRKPPSNSKPAGIDLSWHAKKQRGQLPDEY